MNCSRRGCDVESPRTEQEAKESLQSRRFDVLLLCYSFAPEAADRVCSEFRAYWPDGKVIALSNGMPRKPACPPDVSVSTADAGALVREVVSSVPV